MTGTSVNFERGDDKGNYKLIFLNNNMEDFIVNFITLSLYLHFFLFLINKTENCFNKYQ